MNMISETAYQEQLLDLAQRHNLEVANIYSNYKDFPGALERANEDLSGTTELLGYETELVRERLAYEAKIAELDSQRNLELLTEKEYQEKIEKLAKSHNITVANIYSAYSDIPEALERVKEELEGVSGESKEVADAAKYEAKLKE
jgi:hypothetical protein